MADSKGRERAIGERGFARRGGGRGCGEMLLGGGEGKETAVVFCYFGDGIWGGMGGRLGMLYAFFSTAAGFFLPRLSAHLVW